MDIRDAIEFPYAYFLRKLTFGEFPDLELEEEDFVKLKKAKSILEVSRSIEEKYDVVLENYIQLEQEIAAVCVRSMVRGNGGYSDVHETTRDLNVRVSNLLSASRMYVDHLQSDFKIYRENSANEKSFIKSQIEKCREDKYYELMEGVRNYAQHVRMPISGLSIGGSWSIVKCKKSTCQYSLKIHASKKELSRVRHLKKVLSEFDETIDLKFAIGKYVSILGSLHGEIRKEMDEAVQESRKTLEGWMEKYATASSEDNLIGLTAIRSGDGVIAESIDVHLDWDDIRLELSLRNRGLRDFSIHYVTTISETTLGMEQESLKEQS